MSDDEMRKRLKGFYDEFFFEIIDDKDEAVKFAKKYHAFLDKYKPSWELLEEMEMLDVGESLGMMYNIYREAYYLDKQ